MRTLRNFSTGFVVSLGGALPVGAINIAALDFYMFSGLNGLLLFILGVITVEWFVLLIVLKGSQWLINQPKLIAITELITIVFLVFLALSFSHDAPAQKDVFRLRSSFNYSPLLTGFFLNAVNVFQISFWSGWNIFLINSNYIDVTGRNKYTYITGTSLGTSGGILLFVFFFEFLASQSGSLFRYALPAVCIAFALVQSWRLYKRHFT